MIDHAENTLGAAINSLTRTVAPSLRDDDPQAHEQLRLTVQFLEFLRTRLSDVHRRHAVELTQRIGLARTLLREVATDDAGSGWTELSDAVRHAEVVLSSPTTSTMQLRDAQAEVLRVIRGITRTVRESDPQTSAQIRRVVLRASSAQLALETTWYAPYGFVRNDRELTPLVDLLAAPITA